jgi:hypothetical protein
MEAHIPPKRRLICNGLHGFIFQRIELFITSSVRTSNPTFSTYCSNKSIDFGSERVPMPCCSFLHCICSPCLWEKAEELKWSHEFGLSNGLFPSGSLFIDVHNGKVSLCLISWTLRHEDVWGSGCTYDCTRRSYVHDSNQICWIKMLIDETLCKDINYGTRGTRHTQA